MSVLWWAMACAGPSPEGQWVGTLEIESTDGDEYVNELRVFSKGVRATIYSIVQQEDPDTGETLSLIAESDYDGDWFYADDYTFELRCDWDDCYYNPVMDCRLQNEDRMICNAWPDMFADDREVLDWIREL